MPPNDVKGGPTLVNIGGYSPLRAVQQLPANFSGLSGPGPHRPVSEPIPLPPSLVGGSKASAEAARERWSERRASRLNPVREMDAELKRLREAPVETVSNPGKFQVSVNMAIFRPEDIELLLSPGRLVLCAQSEVRLDDCTSVVRRFRRKLSIPEDVNTDAIATQMSSRGILTITVLRRARG